VTGWARHPARWLVLLGLPIAVLGGVGFAAGRDAKAGWSFLAGFLIALAVVSTGVLMVDVAGRIAPSMAMIAAVSNYVLTTLAFLLLLTVISPDLADVPAFATGLAAAVVPYVAWQLGRARPGQ
jgi:hypothetical protein